MLVSWKWLSKYVELSMDREELEQRLALSGLNHEGTEFVDGDPAVSYTHLTLPTIYSV